MKRILVIMLMVLTGFIVGANDGLEVVDLDGNGELSYSEFMLFTSPAVSPVPSSNFRTGPDFSDEAAVLMVLTVTTLAINGLALLEYGINKDIIRIGSDGKVYNMPDIPWVLNAGWATGCVMVVGYHFIIERR